MYCYNDKKKKANLLYEQYMTESKQKYGLEEINEEKLKNIRLNYEARGSNKAISTIIWYLNLLKIKSELNENVLRFPLILDSPNNVESDDSKEEALFEFIFNNRPENSQLILSTLGFNQGNYTDFVVDNVIELSNEKYCLLNHKDYFDNEQIIREIHDLILDRIMSRVS